MITVQTCLQQFLIFQKPPQPLVLLPCIQKRAFNSTKNNLERSWGLSACEASNFHSNDYYNFVFPTLFFCFQFYVWVIASAKWPVQSSVISRPVTFLWDFWGLFFTPACWDTRLFRSFLLRAELNQNPMHSRFYLSFILLSSSTTILSSHL